MKMLHVAMIAAGLTAASAGTAAAYDTSDESSSNERGRLEILWMATGDPTYAYLIRQIDQQSQTPADRFD